MTDQGKPSMPMRSRQLKPRSRQRPPLCMAGIFKLMLARGRREREKMAVEEKEKRRYFPRTSYALKSLPTEVAILTVAPVAPASINVPYLQIVGYVPASFSEEKRMDASHHNRLPTQREPGRTASTVSSVALRCPSTVLKFMSILR